MPSNVKSSVLFIMLLSTFVARIASAADAEPASLERLATCQNSWMDWKDDDRRMGQYMESFDQGFTWVEEEAAFIPKHAISALGFPVTKVYPQSVGMGIGFSMLLAAPLQQVRSQVEKLVGRTLQCSVGEGMTSCGVELGEHKTVTLVSEGDASGKSSLLGCFYYYEK